MLTASDMPQNCATGVTPEGKTPKSLVEDMIPLLGENEAIVTYVCVALPRVPTPF